MTARNDAMMSRALYEWGRAERAEAEATHYAKENARLLAEIAAKDAEIAELRKKAANEAECGHPWCGDKCGTPSAAMKGDTHE